jgi:hypothetical protein
MIYSGFPAIRSPFSPLWGSDQNRAGVPPTLWYRELAGVLVKKAAFSIVVSTASFGYRELAGVLVKKGVAADEGLLIEVPLRLYASR